MSKPLEALNFHSFTNSLFHVSNLLNVPDFLQSRLFGAPSKIVLLYRVLLSLYVMTSFLPHNLDSDSTIVCPILVFVSPFIILNLSIQENFLVLFHVI